MNSKRASNASFTMSAAESSAWPAASTAAAAGGADSISSPGLETSKEIYTYKAPWDVYALAVSNRPGSKYEHRYAIGSYVEEYNNKVQVCILSWRFVGVCLLKRLHGTQAKCTDCATQGWQSRGRI